MYSYSSSYQNLPVLKWIFILSILLSHDGYSYSTNTTYPPAPLELVFRSVENTFKSVEYSKVLSKKNKTHSAFILLDSFGWLSNWQTEKDRTFFKKQALYSITYFQQYVLKTHRSQYSTEDHLFISTQG